jgi:hypothetical protein
MALCRGYRILVPTTFWDITVNHDKFSNGNATDTGTIPGYTGTGTEEKLQQL